MAELELSIMARGDDPAGDIQPLLDQFEAETHVHVHVTVLTWEQGWTETVKTALYGHGPDVSEIGSTWVGNLIAMDGLRPIAASELYELGGEKAFLPALWQSVGLQGEPGMFAVPWLADTRLIYYRRSWLAKAGLAAATLFDTPAQLTRTLSQLHASGVKPWVMSTTTQRVLHDAASWVWSAGGDFVSADGKRVIFDQPEARSGLKAYFELGRYLTEDLQRLGGLRADDIFRRGQVGGILSDSLTYLRYHPDHLEETADWEVALPPGPPFVGGSNLVIWRHSYQAQQAFKLIKFLTSPPAQVAYTSRVGLLPVRRETFSLPGLVNDPLYRQAAQALYHGRSFPAIRIWGLIEDKLINALDQIWKELFSPAAPEIGQLFDKHLAPLARQLNRTLRA
jgi:multiple sugar transport system substrate-binding protein